MEVRLRDTDAAYIAGILDGEGYITLNRQKRYRKRWNDEVWDYIPRVDITQARRELLDHIASLLEGSYSLRHGGRDGNYWRISLGASSLQWLLPQVIPYLVLKKEIARMVLEYSIFRTRQNHRHKFNENRPWQDEMYKRCKELNSLELYRELNAHTASDSVS